MIVVCFNFMLKQTYSKWLPVWVMSAICALFVGLMWEVAIEQSKTQLALWLTDAALKLSIAVVLTIEVALQMCFCMLAAHLMNTGKVRRRTLWTYRFLRWFPGLLVFPVLFTLLVTTIFAFPGTSFSLIAWSLAGIVFLFIPAGTYLLRWLLPEKELRLEVLFLSNALIAILGIIATVNGRTAVKGIDNVDWAALAGVVVLLLLGGAAGLLHRKLKAKRRKQ